MGAEGESQKLESRRRRNGRPRRAAGKEMMRPDEGKKGGKRRARARPGPGGSRPGFGSIQARPGLFGYARECWKTLTRVLNKINLQNKPLLC